MRPSRLWQPLMVTTVLLAALAACGDDEQPDTGAEHAHGADGLIVVGTGEAPDGRRETRYGLAEGGAPYMVEVSEYAPDAAPTQDQQAAAEDFVEQVRDSTEPFARIEDAEAAGYRHWHDIDDHHLVNPDHVADGKLLDPSRPEFLMFSDDGDLLAAMFLAESNDEPGPQFGGPLTVWHYHPWVPSCWTAGGLLPAEQAPDGPDSCPDDLVHAERSPEMLHVWVVDHPAGPFSSDMVGPFAVSGR